MTARIHILGGGPAGLAAAHYAHREGLSFAVHEAGAETGGNCRTLRIGACGFDTGAHRLHARDPEITPVFRALLGDALLTVEAPSRIVRGTRTFAFPPRPFDLLRQLDARTTLRILRDLLSRRRNARTAQGPENFQALTVKRYGKTLAELFLLGYTRKLWGRDPATLSAAVAGGRLDGLQVSSALREALKRFFSRAGKRGPGPAHPGDPAKTPHLDGAFLYPQGGIGSLFRALEANLPEGSVRTNSRISRIRHDGKILQAFTTTGPEGAEEITVRPGEGVISTLPLPAFLRALDPPPPPDVLRIAERIAFRNLILCVLRLDLPRYSENASLYFPDPALPFTRLYEPKNRSPFLAPARETCVVIEIPCDPSDVLWASPDSAVIERTLAGLESTGRFSRSDVLESAVHRIGHAYPVLECGVEEQVGTLLDWCARFSNLRLAGRNARFRYAHIHDMFRQGRDAVAGFSLF